MMFNSFVDSGIDDNAAPSTVSRMRSIAIMYLFVNPNSWKIFIMLFNKLILL